MAAVDRFEFLFKDIASHYKSLFAPDFDSWTIKDALAAVGAAYLTYKALTLAWRAYKSFKEYGLARMVAKPSLVRTYGGTWAVVTGSGHGIGRAYAEELAGYGLKVLIISLGQEDCDEVAKSIVVTGCTRGIGQAMADELAEYGLNVVLISRNRDSLYNVAADLERKYGVQTCVIAVDFNEGRPVFEKIRTGLEDKDIAILVNNVGVMYDYPQYFLDVPEDKLWQLIHVNMATATMMTYMVLPQMVERGKGAIVTVSSGSCSLPTPQMTVYSATKAYLDYFMKGLAYEYRDSGVVFQTLMPFYVATRMTRYSSTLSHTSLWIPSASGTCKIPIYFTQTQTLDYAEQAVRTLGWGCRTAGYWPHCIQRFMVGMIPEWCWMWGSTRLNGALRRQASQRKRHRSSQSRISTSVSEGNIRSMRSGSFTGLTSGVVHRSRTGPDLVTSTNPSATSSAATEREAALRKKSAPAMYYQAPPPESSTTSRSDTTSSFYSAQSLLSDPGPSSGSGALSGSTSYETLNSDKTPTPPSSDGTTPTTSNNVPSFT